MNSTGLEGLPTCCKRAMKRCFSSCRLSCWFTPLSPLCSPAPLLTTAPLWDLSHAGGSCQKRGRRLCKEWGKWMFLRKLQKNMQVMLQESAEYNTNANQTHDQAVTGQEARGITKHAMMLDCSKISCHGRRCVVNLRWPCSVLGPRASGSCPWDLEKALVKHGTQIWAEGPVCGGAGICRMGGVGVWGCRPHSCRWVRIHFTT